MFRTSLASAALALLATPLAAETYDLDALRAATEKYRDVEVALADGYMPDPEGHCVSAAAEGLPAELGAMGIHYLHPAMLGLAAPGERVDGDGTHTDFTKPAILLYEPQADGSLELVGIENLVFKKAWEEAGNDGPPQINGRLWDAMADDPATDEDEAHGFMPHYDQHVWLFRENPSGELEPFNPNVSCDHAGH
ncbi:hypothetical protein [Limimaricola soesokkakensis]|uniref:hypothetical protein n=1 Tax=Limimaricola soesokkakensis TaxID=1343159 RepID=UPI003514556C